ncbi:MAG: DUF4867 family protein [Chloroflexota bacterium]|nr:DUF4867 family protein [Chloroflexota bacterium]
MTETLTALQKENQDLGILAVTDHRFARYGRILEGFSAEKATAFARENALPGEESVYEPSIAGLEADEEFVWAVSQQVYGGMPVQVGWCYGRNLQLNGLEYHKGPEVIVAVTDLALLLGGIEDLEWGEHITYDASQVEAFFVPQSTIVELHPWCLHFAPCHIHEDTGFRALIVLPQDTNLPLDFEPREAGEPALLFARNKWLIIHPEAEALVQQGAYVGIEGANPSLQAL